jgi:hypothetical protein
VQYPQRGVQVPLTAEHEEVSIYIDWLLLNRQRLTFSGYQQANHKTIKRRTLQEHERFWDAHKSKEQSLHTLDVKLC